MQHLATCLVVATICSCASPEPKKSVFERVNDDRLAEGFTKAVAEASAPTSLTAVGPSIPSNVGRLVLVIEDCKPIDDVGAISPPGGGQFVPAYRPTLTSAFTQALLRQGFDVLALGELGVRQDIIDTIEASFSVGRLDQASLRALEFEGVGGIAIIRLNAWEVQPTGAGFSSKASLDVRLTGINSDRILAQGSHSVTESSGRFNMGEPLTTCAKVLSEDFARSLRTALNQ